MKLIARFKSWNVIFFILILLIPLILLTQEWRMCIRVIDGDTIVLDGDEKVRIIGVDTPEKSVIFFFGSFVYCWYIGDYYVWPVRSGL